MLSAFVSDYILVAEKSECAGKETFQGEKESLGACATACRGFSQMFIYGTNSHGNSRCSNAGCKCWCQGETEGWKCKKRIQHTGFDLYAFKQTKGTTFCLKSVNFHVDIWI